MATWLLPQQRCHRNSSGPSECLQRGRSHRETDGERRNGAPSPGAGEINLVNTGTFPAPFKEGGPRAPFRKAVGSKRLKAVPALGPVHPSDGNYPEEQPRRQTKLRFFVLLITTANKTPFHQPPRSSPVSGHILIRAPGTQHNVWDRRSPRCGGMMGTTPEKSTRGTFCI